MIYKINYGKLLTSARPLVPKPVFFSSGAISSYLGSANEDGSGTSRWMKRTKLLFDMEFLLAEQKRRFLFFFHFEGFRWKMLNY